MIAWPLYRRLKNDAVENIRRCKGLAIHDHDGVFVTVGKLLHFSIPDIYILITADDVKTIMIEIYTADHLIPVRMYIVQCSIPISVEIELLPLPVNHRLKKTGLLLPKTPGAVVVDFRRLVGQ